MYTCKDLKLIVTSKPGKERVVEYQVGDSIYLEDPDVRIVHTRYSGVLLVYTRLNPWRAFWLVSTYPIHGASRIVPVECCSEGMIGEVLECIDRLLNKHKQKEHNEKVGLEITVRGNLIDEKELRKLVCDIIEKGGLKVVFKNAKYEVKIEVVDNIIGVSIIPWRIDRVSRRIREWVRRLRFNVFLF